MKTRLTFFFLLILAGFSVWYFVLSKKSQLSEVNGLIPQGSVAVLHIKNPQKTLEELSRFPWWNSLKSLPFLDESNDLMGSIDSLIAAGQLSSQLHQLEHTLSIHITGNDQLETLHFVKAQGFSWSSGSILETLKMISPDEIEKMSGRIYEGQTITELSVQDKDFAFLILDDLIVYSSNAILVEDVVRTSNGLTNSLYETFDFSFSPVNDVVIVFNQSKLNDLKDVFFRNEASTNNNIQGLIQLNLNLSDQGINTNGRLTLKPGFNLEDYEDVPIRERDFLPNGLSSVKTVPIKGGSLEETLIDYEQLLSRATGSLTFVEVDAGNEEKDWVGITTLTDGAFVQGLLEELSLKLVKNETDTLYQEEFMNFPIAYLNKPGVFNEAFGFNSPKLKETYFVIFNEVLLFAESVNAIKLVLREYDDEDTWGKTVERRKFLDDLAQEAVMTRLFDFQYSVDALKAGLKPKWKTFFENKQSLLDIVDLVSVQLSSSGNTYFASAQTTLNPIVRTSTTAVGPINLALDLEANMFADNEIITKPFVVRNHNTAEQEIFIQDRAGQVYLISRDGTLLWKRDLGSTINGSVRQIDYYNNRKLQYLFTTDSLIYLVDRNGQDVEGFPKQISLPLPLLDLNDIDYDNSKRYRYAGQDRRGNVYLFDKEGNLLEGWNPRNGQSPLLEVPRHIRVRGRDCFVLVRRNGEIELTNRRGELYPGFPFKLDKRLSGDVKISQGPDFERTTITVVTEDGEQVGVNLNGKVKTRNQLFKPNVSSKFTLVNDRSGVAHVVVRKDSRGTTFFDSNGEELFTSELILDEDDRVAFYNFRNRSEIFIINQDGKLHLLDRSGKAKLENAISTNNDIGLVYYQSRGEYELFINFDNQFAIYRFSK